MSFDPNAAAGDDSGIFGLPFTRAESKVVLLPVPWDVTTSYRPGTAFGPKDILEASRQVDLFDLEVGKAYEKGYFLEEIPLELAELNAKLRKKMDHARLEGELSSSLIAEVNQACEKMNVWVYEGIQEILKDGKVAGLVGGDHSTPFSSIRAHSEKYGGKLGVLHIDAHADLRESYEGFKYSHASIMFNVMESSWKPQKIVQVGIRDFCEEEFNYIKDSDGRIKTFFDLHLKNKLLSGTSWKSLASEIISELPENIYLSFDIDGLDPKLCPHTGTPVPGGMSYNEILFLLAEIRAQKKKIVGFDLNEVATGRLAGSDGEPTGKTTDEWDANVASRLLYKICGWSVG